MERRLVFIRHGEAYSNLNIELRSKYDDEVFFDTKLTLKGEEQCQKKRIEINDKFNIIYTSTLDRALQTSDIIFGDKSAPIVANENLREYKNCRSSYRKDLTYKKNVFPNIDFSSIKYQIDTLPIEINKTKKLCGFIPYSKQEASHFMMKRVKNFLDVIASTNHSNIAIVSHRGFIYMFNRFFDRHVDLDNCEMYRVKLWI